MNKTLLLLLSVTVVIGAYSFIPLEWIPESEAVVINEVYTSSDKVEFVNDELIINDTWNKLQKDEEGNYLYLPPIENRTGVIHANDPRIFFVDLDAIVTYEKQLEKIQRTVDYILFWKGTHTDSLGFYQ